MNERSSPLSRFLGSLGSRLQSPVPGLPGLQSSVPGFPRLPGFQSPVHGLAEPISPVPGSLDSSPLSSDVLGPFCSKDDRTVRREKGREGKGRTE